MWLLICITIGLHSCVVGVAISYLPELTCHRAKATVATCASASLGCLMAFAYFFLENDGEISRTLIVWIAFAAFNGAFYLSLIRSHGLHDCGERRP